MEKRYYLPISSKSLAHYFGCACIKPAKYFGNKPEDLQDRFKDFLLMTNCIGTRQTDCCLEIVLTPREAEGVLNIGDGFFLYEKPLPLSRVRSIYFADREQQMQTLANIRLSTAFVPDNLIKQVEMFDNPPIEQIALPQAIQTHSYTEPLRRFDSYLGGFALLRLAGEAYMNYSENYFSTLAFFNETIREELRKANQAIDNKYWGVFTGNHGFQRIFPILNKTVDENDVILLAQEEKQLIRKDRITRMIDLNALDQNTYIAAVLNTYGTGNESKRKRIDELILSNFKKGIKAGKSEGIALCYGINRGYTAFSNKYRSGDTEKRVKFELNSRLDYYTIESLYQYAFNPQAPERDFSFLNWCPLLEEKARPNHPTDYNILDVHVIGKKKIKVLSDEYWQNVLPSLLHRDRFFEKKLPELFQELGEILYKDIKEELEEEMKARTVSKPEDKTYTSPATSDWRLNLE